MCARTKVKMELELCGAQEEKERHKYRLLDALRKQPPLASNTPDMCEKYLGPERQEPELPGVKEEESKPPGGKKEDQLQRPNFKTEEQLPPCMKEEEEFEELPVTGVHVKTEDEKCRYEENKGVEPPSSASSQHVITETDSAESQADGQLAPISDGGPTTSHSPHTDVDDEELEGGMTRHTGSKRWKCSQCGKTFAYKSFLKRHMIGHTGEKPFACAVCGKKFTRNGNLTQHTRAHTSEKELPVTVVHVKSRDEEQWEENRGADPPSNISIEQMTRDIDGEHCEGSHAESWLAPMSDGDDTTSQSPRTDDDNAESEGAMTYHNDSKRWKCSRCVKTFAGKYDLKRHMIIHTGEKPFACAVCGQRFSRKDSMREHLKTHTGEKPFACSVCGQTYSFKANFRRHLQTHTGEKPFGCSVCGHNFSGKAQLKVHTRIHTGEKPFACSFCGHRFALKANLDSHTRTHTGEKPFPCSFCDKRFSFIGSLRQHTRIHTGEKPFACSVCNQRFQSKCSAQKHKCALGNSSDQGSGI